ncbi:unnamed protein product [Paramecium octaurelia]|uniref:Uncharacterized protein n=1 Tax=Paramecium octaurelia TaxID=43137 RepID=A0A8S1UWL2_PAROT|nr:unnamed protein product [Paramecium octaurelia]
MMVSERSALDDKVLRVVLRKKIKERRGGFNGEQYGHLKKDKDFELEFTYKQHKTTSIFSSIETSKQNILAVH